MSLSTRPLYGPVRGGIPCAFSRWADGTRSPVCRNDAAHRIRPCAWGNGMAPLEGTRPLVLSALERTNKARGCLEQEASLKGVWLSVLSSRKNQRLSPSGNAAKPRSLRTGRTRWAQEGVLCTKGCAFSPSAKRTGLPSRPSDPRMGRVLREAQRRRRKRSVCRGVGERRKPRKKAIPLNTPVIEDWEGIHMNKVEQT